MGPFRPVCTSGGLRLALSRPLPHAMVRLLPMKHVIMQQPAVREQCGHVTSFQIVPSYLRRWMLNVFSVVFFSGFGGAQICQALFIFICLPHSPEIRSDDRCWITICLFLDPSCGSSLWMDGWIRCGPHITVCLHPPLRHMHLLCLPAGQAVLPVLWHLCQVLRVSQRSGFRVYKQAGLVRFRVNLGTSEFCLRRTG